jgi:hypothetical protein
MEGAKEVVASRVAECLIFGLLTVGTSLAIFPSFRKAVQSGERILRILRRKPALDFDGEGYFMVRNEKLLLYWRYSINIHTILPSGRL